VEGGGVRGGSGGRGAWCLGGWRWHGTRRGGDAPPGGRRLGQALGALGAGRCSCVPPAAARQAPGCPTERARSRPAGSPKVAPAWHVWLGARGVPRRAALVPVLVVACGGAPQAVHPSHGSSNGGRDGAAGGSSGGGGPACWRRASRRIGMLASCGTQGATGGDPIQSCTRLRADRGCCWPSGPLAVWPRRAPGRAEPPWPSVAAAQQARLRLRCAPPLTDRHHVGAAAGDGLDAVHELVPHPRVPIGVGQVAGVQRKAGPALPAAHGELACERRKGCRCASALFLALLREGK
jgi:hypothetical protein